MKNALYAKLNTKKSELKEDVFVKPLDSYETIISSVNYALTQNEAIDELIDELEKESEMDECDMAEESPKVSLYPFLIATYPAFCLFEIGTKTFRCDYKYDKKTRNVTLGIPSEVTLDVTVTTK